MNPTHRERFSNCARPLCRRLGIVCAALTLFFASGPPVFGQSVLDRPPNLTGGWVGEPGRLHFNFLHRFQVADPKEKVVNSPTFFVTASLPGRLVIGGVYATNSLTSVRSPTSFDFDIEYNPNELEAFVRVAPVTEQSGGPLDLAVQGGYNTAAESFDGEVTIAKWAGPVRFVATGRGFTDAYGTSNARGAVAGGASIKLTDHVALASDVATLLDREGATEDVAWSAGLQLQVPLTPHTLSLQAGNTQTGTLQGTSRGIPGGVRWGFEFTVPLTLGRFFGSGRPAEEAPVETMAGDVVEVEIRGLAYRAQRIAVEAGTTVRWVNRDPVQHTATADDGAWGSELLGPGESFERTFQDPGDYGYHCTPHPFMTGVVIVR